MVEERRMRLTKEELSARVVVRRATIGSALFQWEVHWADRAEPVFVSPRQIRQHGCSLSRGPRQIAGVYATEAGAQAWPG